jgi:hypothetical protein
MRAPSPAPASSTRLSADKPGTAAAMRASLASTSGVMEACSEPIAPSKYCAWNSSCSSREAGAAAGCFRPEAAAVRGGGGGTAAAQPRRDSSRDDNNFAAALLPHDRTDRLAIAAATADIAAGSADLGMWGLKNS